MYSGYRNHIYRFLDVCLRGRHLLHRVEPLWLYIMTSGRCRQRQDLFVFFFDSRRALYV